MGLISGVWRLGLSLFLEKIRLSANPGWNANAGW